MPLRAAALLLALAWAASAQTAISELTSYWSGDPNTSGHMYDYENSADAMFYPVEVLTESGDILGGGWTAGSAGPDGVAGRMIVASALNQATTSFVYAFWVKVTANAKILKVGNNDFYLKWNNANPAKLEVGCKDASDSNLFLLDGTTIATGTVVLAWAGWDGTNLRVAVNGEAWGATAAACDLNDINAGDLEIYGPSGRGLSWMNNYTPTDAEIAAIYNSGSGRDCLYFGCTATEPTAPLTVSLIDAEFALDTGLPENTQGLYFLRPYPCKDWSAMTCTADYVWMRSTDHDVDGGNPDGVYIGWSSSPSTLPSSWTLVKDGAALTTDETAGVTWTQLETPHLEYDGVDEVFLYAHAVDFNTSSPVQQTTHVWRTSDFSTWTYVGEALTRDGNDRNHTGYATIVRRGAGDWVANSLIRDSTNPNGSASGWWSSTDGLTWTFEGEIDFIDQPYPYTGFAFRNLLTSHVLGFSGYGSGAGYIATQDATNELEGDYPPWHLFSHGGTNSGGDWLQSVRAYEENGVVHIYAKMSYQEPSTVAYYRGTLAGENNLTYSFDADEITELDYLGTDFAQNVDAGVDFIGGVYHNDSETPTTCSATETLNGDGWTHRCNSGGDKDTEVDVTISQPDTDSMQMAIAVTNHDGDDDLTRIVLNPLEITNPGVNIQNCNSVQRRAGREHGPAFILSGTWGAWTIGLSSFPAGWQLTTFCTDEDTVNFDIQITNTHAAVIDDPQDVIAPGETVTVTLVMRFGAAGSDVDDLATESYSAWRTAFPYRMSWADPRPIATWFLSSEASVNVTTNPRGFIQSITDWTDESDFTTKLLAATDTVVSLAQGMDPQPQGIILWDVEGGEFPHAFTYAGDQTALCAITPEMCYLVGGVPLIDEMINRLHAGGLRVGFTLRPQDPIAYGTTLPTSCDAPPSAFDDTAATYDFTGTFIKTDNALSPRGNRGYRCNDAGDGTVQDVLYWQRHRDTNAEVVAELSRKIRYDVDRWNASIFYVDTNNLSGTYSHEIFDALAKEFPDLLILPEWETSTYASVAFPYGELDLGDGGATTEEKRLYPQARRVLNIMDGDRAAGSSTIVSAMREGSPTLHRGWFADDSIDDTETLYTQALAANGVVTLSTGERYETTIPIVERVKGSCYPHEAVVRFAANTTILNSCNPWLADCPSTTVCRSSDSPCTVAEKTAYRMEIHNALGEMCSAGPVQ